jgi:hypothetical protein
MGTSPTLHTSAKDRFYEALLVPAFPARGTRFRVIRVPSVKVWERNALLVLCFLLCGCGKWPARSEPSIEFTKVPPAGEGGTDTAGTIEGRVSGARAGEQIVLFARSGQWWVQPLANQPFTKIQANSQWSNSTHLGTEYAALLVASGYRAPATLDSLPSTGVTVLAVASVKGAPAPPEVTKTIRFSGYEWRVRTAPSNRGGSITHYDPENVWTDARGQLHLRIANGSGQWTCAEVSLNRSLGYGLYRFVVRDSSQLDPAAVLSIFTWDDSGQDPSHREFGVEITRWGDPLSKNAQYAVQPYYVPANVDRFMIPSGILTHSFQWEPTKVSFRTSRGADAGKGLQTVAEHLFSSGVPVPGGELIHMNLYLFGNAVTPLSKPAEVVIEKFEYLP